MQILFFILSASTLRFCAILICWNRRKSFEMLFNAALLPLAVWSCFLPSPPPVVLALLMTLFLWQVHFSYGYLTTFLYDEMGTTPFSRPIQWFLIVWGLIAIFTYVSFRDLHYLINGTLAESDEK